MTVQERTAHALFAPMERADAGRQAIRLLVSVQNAAEARAAVDGGAELIDVKQPSRGSLGMATLDDITQVAEFLEDSGHGQPLSVALGEIGDWMDGVEVPPLPPTVAVVKMGLTRAANRPDWRSEWLDVRRRFEDAAARPLDWVAVIYVDGERFGCPDATDVIRAASSRGSGGGLTDVRVSSVCLPRRSCIRWPRLRNSTACLWRWPVRFRSGTFRRQGSYRST